MIVEQEKIYTVGNLEDTLNVTVSLKKQAKLIQILTGNLYKDAIGSIVRELTSNLFDSHLDAGVTDAVKIKSDSDENGDFVSFIDYGTGMNPDIIKNVYGQLLESTKENNEDAIGYYGLGSKTPLAYTDSFYVITIVDNIKYTYLVFKTEGITITPLIEEETESGNGTEIKMYYVSNDDGYDYDKHEYKTKDKNKFEEKLKEQLAYFDEVVYEGFDINNDYQIIEAKNKKGDILWKYRPDITIDTLHICRGKCLYNIDWSKIGMNSINLPIGIYFTASELMVTPSREDIQYTESTIKLLKERIIETVEDVINRYNKETTAIEELDIYEARLKEWTEQTYTSFDTKFNLTPEIELNFRRRDLKTSYPNLYNKLAEPKWKPIAHIPLSPKNIFNIFYYNRYSFRDGSIRQIKSYSKESKMYISNELASSKLKNEYFQNGKVVGEFKLKAIYLNIGFSKNKENWHYLGKAYAIKQIKDAVTKYYKDKNLLKEYDRYILSEKWIEEYRLSKKQSSTKKIKITGIMSYKKIEYGLTYPKEANLELLNKDTPLIIYGFRKDLEQLKLAEYICHWTSKATGNSKKYIPYLIMQIAINNEKILKQLDTPTIMEVNKFMTYEQNAILQRFVSYHIIRENEMWKFVRQNTAYLTDMLPYISQSIGKIQEFLHLNYRNCNLYNTDNENVKLLIQQSFENGIINKEVFYEFNKLKNIFKDCEVLFELNITNDNQDRIIKFLRDKKIKLGLKYYQSNNITKQIEVPKWRDFSNTFGKCQIQENLTYNTIYNYG